HLDLLVRQAADDEPGASVEKGDAATIVGQSLDPQLLLLAHRHLRRTLAAARLEAQPAATLGHDQALRRPDRKATTPGLVLAGSSFSARGLRTRRWTGSGRHDRR